MTPHTLSTNSDLDEHADEEIGSCFNIDRPRSFFLYAGAGSGKTRSLVKAIDRLRREHGPHLRRHGQKIGVITYTNAACDEIVRRTEADPVVQVRTIHSFAWLLIGGFNRDIREWLRGWLAEKAERLLREEAGGRRGSKASIHRRTQIERLQQRRLDLKSIRRFIYSPTSDNREWDALNHGEVIKICADFLSSKPTMQRILVNAYPFLLVDESQDTQGELIDALFVVQAAHRSRFCLGLLGDTMQRIYGHGKTNVEGAIPDDWAKPVKKLNHRCPKRIVRLINKVRSTVDDHEQIARHDTPEGFMRFFILPSDHANKPGVEEAARFRMAEGTGDTDWTDALKCKTLILEHHMAARRMDFVDMFRPLYSVENFRTELFEGTLGAVSLFAHQVLPLVQAELHGDRFTVARLMRGVSPLLSPQAFREAADQLGQIAKAKAAVESLVDLLRHGERTFGEVLQEVAASGVFTIPESLLPYCGTGVSEAPDDPSDQLSERQKALAEFLTAPFSQIEPYARYVAGDAPFDTHQGVKGREFPRVMVIMDDKETRGFSFSYDILFGARSQTDLRRKSADEESTADRTRRLFYVTCSRAKESLALVTYSAKPVDVRSYLLRSGWCEEEEIVMDLL